MHPDLAQLVLLQAHDIEAKRLRDQAADWQSTSSRSKPKPRPPAASAPSSLDLIAKEEALRRKEESEIADLRQKLERTKKKLDMTTTTAPA